MQHEALYQLLLREPGPRMLQEALKLVGIKEITGPRHSSQIMAMADYLHINSIYKNDETAWCGLAHGYVIVRSGKYLPLKDYDILRAKKYLEFGDPIDTPELGDTLIFDREGGGHVGLYVAETPASYVVLGGNQSNMYGFTEITKNRLVGARRPKYMNKPANIRRIYVDSTGKLSSNEA